MTRKSILTAFMALVTVFSAAASEARTFNVTTTLDHVDTNPGDGICFARWRSSINSAWRTGCSLRAAVQEANALWGHDTIRLGHGTYLLTRFDAYSTGFPSRTDPEYTAKNDLDVWDNVTIQGAGEDNTRIEVLETRVDDIPGSPPWYTAIGRAFDVGTARRLTLKDLSVRGGYGHDGGMIRVNRGSLRAERVHFSGSSGFDGLVIHATSSSLSLLDCVLSGAGMEFTGWGAGGAIYLSDSDLEMKRSTIQSISTPRMGATAISMQDSTAVISDSWIKSNRNRSRGSTIWASRSELDIERTTLSGNYSMEGTSALDLVDSVARIENSTMSGNDRHARSYGGVISMTRSDAVLANVTMTESNLEGAPSTSRPSPPVLRVDADSALFVKNSVIAGNEGRECGTSRIISRGYSILGPDCAETAGASDLVGIGDLNLTPLGSHGGYADTHYPGFGSPVINAGHPWKCTNAYDLEGFGAFRALADDQRGNARPYGGRCDIGAVEWQLTGLTQPIRPIPLPGIGGLGGGGF